MWVIYALLSAFFIASTDPIAKKALKGSSDEYLVGWFIIFFSTPFLALSYLFYAPVLFGPALIKVLIAVIPLEIAATILYYKALKLTDISLSVPFVALTPVFIIITGFLILGEKIRLSGVMGIALITIGVYSINIKETHRGFTYPLKAIFFNRGSLYMVIVAIIYSVTSVVSKKAMLLTSPETIPFIYNSSISLAMLPVILFRLKRGYSVLAKGYKVILIYAALGFLSALSGIFYFKSVSLTTVAYAISIKRLSLLMSVGYGWLFFRERDIHIRLASTFCMFLGVVLILLG